MTSTPGFCGGSGADTAFILGSGNVNPCWTDLLLYSVPTFLALASLVDAVAHSVRAASASGARSGGGGGATRCCARLMASPLDMSRLTLFVLTAFWPLLMFVVTHLLTDKHKEIPAFEIVATAMRFSAWTAAAAVVVLNNAHRNAPESPLARAFYATYALCATAGITLIVMDLYLKVREEGQCCVCV